MGTQESETNQVWIVLVVLGVLLVIPTLFMGVGMMGAGPMMGGMSHDGMWGSGGTVPGWVPLVGLVMQLGFLLVVIGGAYLVIRALTTDGDVQDRAMEEARLAYARGDLTDEEFERRRETLERDD